MAQTSRLRRARTAERRDDRAVHFDGRRLLSELHGALGVARYVAVRLHKQAVHASARPHSGRLKKLGARAPAFQTSRTCIHFEVCDSRPSPSPSPLVERRSPRWACPGVTVMVCASISSGETVTSDALATLVRSLPAPKKRSTVSHCSHTGGCRRCALAKALRALRRPRPFAGKQTHLALLQSTDCWCSSRREGHHALLASTGSPATFQDAATPAWLCPCVVSTDCRDAGTGAEEQRRRRLCFPGGPPAREMRCSILSLKSKLSFALRRPAT